MEIIVTFFLLGLLSISVCNLFKAKAKVIVIITALILIGYIVVVILTVDLAALWNTFLLWLEVLGRQIMGDK